MSSLLLKWLYIPFTNFSFTEKESVFVSFFRLNNVLKKIMSSILGIDELRKLIGDKLSTMRDVPIYMFYLSDDDLKKHKTELPLKSFSSEILKEAIELWKLTEILVISMNRLKIQISL